jgi:Ethanolamine utilization protein EutJ (predicted chaperonin)
MGIGTSIFLIAIGAILSYAVEDAVSGVDLGTVGVILMVVGIAGLVISLLYTLIWADRTRDVGVVRDRYVEREPLP